MSTSTESGFEIGAEYENEKGVFTVMSIEKDEMLIRWANGEEAQTSLEFQDRIQQRRQWERKKREEKEAAANTPPGKAKSAKKAPKAPSE